AHLAASDDNVLFVLIYLQMVEGLRPDVDLVLQGVGGADLQPLHFDPDREPLFFTHHPNWDFPLLDAVPRGLAFRVVRAGAPVPAAAPSRARLEGEEDPRVPKDYLTRNLIGHFHYMLGLTHEADGDWLRAAGEFAIAATASPENDVLFYNLGLVYARAGLYDRALEAFERSHDINPRHLASQGRVEAGDRIAELAVERERIRRLEDRLTAEAGLDGLHGAAYHRALAEQLERASEPTAARGHRLLAIEAEAPWPRGPE
ncbi:MAG: tetratricopeptide repeat protein, partial [Thermoanaerobaculia bacterium]